MSCVFEIKIVLFSFKRAQDQITVRVVSEVSMALGGEGPGPLLTALQDRDGDFDFSMTNPPFFASEEEVIIVEWIMTHILNARGFVGRHVEQIMTQP